MADRPLHPLLDPVREGVLKAVKFLGAASSEEVAKACHLSHGAARMHLVTLRNLGLVEYGKDRPLRPGRPRHLFWLTPGGDALFPCADQETADALLTSLEAIVPDQTAAVIAHSADVRFEHVMAELPDSRWQPAGGRLDAVLKHCGYFPVTRDLGDGTREVVFRHCPLLSLAREHPKLCAAEARFLELVLGEGNPAPKRLQYRLAGDDVCSYLIRDGDGAASESAPAAGTSREVKG